MVGELHVVELVAVRAEDVGCGLGGRVLGGGGICSLLGISPS